MEKGGMKQGKEGMSNHFMIKDGKVMMMKNGQSSALTKDYMFKDGSSLNSTGTVTMTDGSTKMLKDGNMLGMDGKWSNKNDNWGDKKRTKGAMKDSMRTMNQKDSINMENRK